MSRFRSLAAAALCIAMAVVIYLFSAADSETSARTSDGITREVVEVTVPDFSQKPAEQQQAILQQTGHRVRKTAHFAEYACLGFLLNCYAAAPLTWCSRGKAFRRFVTRFRIPLALAVALLYALTDELHQAFVPGRGPALTDSGLDFLGACFGTLVFLVLSALIYRILRKKRRKKQEMPL